ncbi:porin [Polynucleobacter paneuropaeus]|nr:porin [Polynucleobacter paneuropaeus]
MKKSLFALAAVGALAGVAHAQSSVTVYGILDVGYVGGNARAMSTANTTNGGQSKITVNQFGQSAEQTSRLGFKGNEDLGGGKSAFFTAEFQLYPEDQQSSGNTNTGLLNRQTFVGLKQNGIGQGAIGLQYTPVYNAQAVTDPGMNNNILGNVVYVSSTGTSSSTSGSLAGGAFGNNAALTNRTANTLTVQSDSFAGFRANAMYTLNNKNATQTSATAGGNTNASGWGLGADFTYNKAYVTAAYQALKQNNTNANGTVATGTCTGDASNNVPCLWTNAQASGATATTGTASTGLNTSYADNIQDNQFFAGATYDFGILKAFAQYVNRKATSTANSAYSYSRAAEQIGVRSYITPTIEAWASAGMGKVTLLNGSTTANTPTNFNAWQLGSNYWLSKRTNLYAIYGQVNTSTNSYNAISDGKTVTANSGASNYAVGVRHTF